MRLLDVKGRLVNKNVAGYAVDWEGKTRSKIQNKVKSFLRPYWKGHVVYEEFPVFGTLLKVDMLNATVKIAIEVNGPQHGQFHYFHDKSPAKYLHSIKNDFKKLEWLEKNGFQLLEINYDEIDDLSYKFFKEKFSVDL